MRTIVVDVESYYDQEYSLRKMTPVQYILDHRWETIGWAVKDGDSETVWMTDEEFRVFLRGLPPKVAMVSHNALFDMCVLAWRYGYTPHIMIDTLGMARAWMGYKMRSLALASIAKYRGIGAKGDTVHKVQGMNLAAIKAAGFYDEYASYSKTDADLCWQIYRGLIAEGFPVSEIAVMDSVLRCAVQPSFVLDQALLAEHLHAVQADKESLMQRVGVANHDSFGAGVSTTDVLMSNELFANALRLLGVEPPMKISPVTGKEAYAFAKTDAAFIELEEHENPDVQALVSARLGVKSTIEETRTQRLLDVSHLTWPGNQQRLMPMPLRYSGAHTHRLSGDWRLNMQNLPSRGNNRIRSALCAPDGKLVVAVDASQIEARVAGWFCGARGLTNAFANKEDVYSTFASSVFNYEVVKQTHKVERFIGKTAVLGLQYGLGWPKFQTTVAMQSKAQVGQEVVLDDMEAARVVQTYRREYKEIPAMWRKLDNLISQMTSRNCYVELGPLIFMHEKIKLPSGLFLHYHDLQNRDGQWWFTYGGKPKYLYGGKLLENIVQALARICVMDTAVNVRRRLAAEGHDGIRLNLQVHDELVYITPAGQAEWLRDMVIEEMCKPPRWGMDIPLDAEGAAGPSYGDAK
ncbi:MAG TPA: DNA polymerase [Acidimicrobiia bacterium]